MSTNKAHYATALLPHAKAVVGAVHCDGPAALLDAIRRARAVPAPAGVDPDVAMYAILAALVDPDKTDQELLAWACDPSEVRMTVLPDGRQINEVAVERALQGRLGAGKLTPTELGEAVLVMTLLGVPIREIARRCNCGHTTVGRIRAAFMRVATPTAAAQHGRQESVA